MKKMVLPSLLMAVSSIMLVNCSEYTDFDVSQKLDAVQRMNEYSNSFKEIYGEIPADKSWDFTKSPKAATRATITAGKDTTFTKEFITTLSKILPEQNAKNHELGVSYVLFFNGPFDIYPLLHGQCQRFSIYVNDVKLGSYTDIMKKLNDSRSSANGRDHDNYNNGKSYSYNSVKEQTPADLTTTGWRIDGFKQGEPLLIQLVLEESNSSSSNPTFGKKGDVSTSIYDKPWAIKANDYTKKYYGNETQYLAFGSMILPNDVLLSKGIQLPEDQMIIMFEDGHRDMCDMDFNDIIFTIKGRPTLPSKIDTETDTLRWTERKAIEKRYMVEDLGATSTSDIDFNDIVVDLTDITEQKYKCTMTITTTYIGGQAHTTITTSDTVEVGDPIIKQSAALRAMGGIMDYSIKVGGKEIFRKSKTSEVSPYPKDFADWRWEFPTEKKFFDYTVMYNTGWAGEGNYDKALDYDRKMCYAEVEGGFGWVPDSNNIVVYVYENMNADSQIGDNDYSKYEDSQAVKITFPERGEVPCMVAFKPTKEWRWEMKSINGDEYGDKAYEKGDGTVYSYFSNYHKPAENE